MKERVVNGHEVNCMARNMKDRIWIFSDKKLLTKEKKANEGLVDSLGIASRRFPCSYGANMSRR